jgi:hypothetical protein
VPAAPLIVTTKEPDENEDEDEIVFTDSAWCCIVPNAPDKKTWIVPHAPSNDKTPSTWCRVADEDEVFYENSAWYCVVPNAPDSETTFTHVPATIDSNANDDKMETFSTKKRQVQKVSAFVRRMRYVIPITYLNLFRTTVDCGGLWYG